MHHAPSRPLLAVAAFATTGALALAPITVTPGDLPAAGVSPQRISTEAVQLTDSWSTLFADTATSVGDLVGLTLGNNSFPLPPLTFPLAPIVTQLVLNQVAYAGLIINGQGGQIPGWIGAHLTELGEVAQLLVTVAPGVVLTQIKVPIDAAVQTVQYIATSGNPLYALTQAPAVFLNKALNDQFGLLGLGGPIGLALSFRNLVAAAIYTPLPTIVLPFKKASGESAKASSPEGPVTAPSGTAGSARSKPKASSSASAPAKKADSAKAGNARGGTGHGKR